MIRKREFGVVVEGQRGSVQEPFAFTWALLSELQNVSTV